MQALRNSIVVTAVESRISRLAIDFECEASVSVRLMQRIITRERQPDVRRPSRSPTGTLFFSVTHL